MEAASQVVTEFDSCGDPPAPFVAPDSPEERNRDRDFFLQSSSIVCIERPSL